jgi:hypothetical protein
MATQDTTNTRTPTDVEIQDSTGEGDDIREEDIPQQTSVVAQCRFWWRFSMWPLVFLAANAVVIFCLMLDGSVKERWIRLIRTDHAVYDCSQFNLDFSPATNAAI